MVCNKAISTVSGPRDFIQVTVDKNNGGDVSYLSGFLDSVKVHYDFIEKNCVYNVVEVNTITIPQLYEDYKLPYYIDFLSVDVEGAELEVFQGIDFNLHKFGLIAFEHNGNEVVRKQIGAMLERAGYEYIPLISLEWDDMYTNKELLWD